MQQPSKLFQIGCHHLKCQNLITQCMIAGCRKKDCQAWNYAKKDAMHCKTYRKLNNHKNCLRDCEWMFVLDNKPLNRLLCCKHQWLLHKPLIFVIVLWNHTEALKFEICACKSTIYCTWCGNKKIKLIFVHNFVKKSTDFNAVFTVTFKQLCDGANITHLT